MVMILGVFVGREAEGQKIAACGSSGSSGRGRSFIAGEKKGLAKQDLS
jgi:hypothetical protein